MKINWWRVLHWLIILTFATNILYGYYMVFFVIGGGFSPLFQRATATPVEVILKRRLYAVEVWVGFSGLAVYLALTELLPRKLPQLLGLFEESDGGDDDHEDTKGTKG